MTCFAFRPLKEHIAILFKEKKKKEKQNENHRGWKKLAVKHRLLVGKQRLNGLLQ
jgi:hypothetical protein